MKASSRLPPAHTLTITGRQIVKRRYWRAEETPELHLPREEDYHEQFLELYQAAVNSRLRSLRPVGATLSGGLDSGSVCTLAARELADAGTTFAGLQFHPAIPHRGPDPSATVLATNRPISKPRPAGPAILILLIYPPPMSAPWRASGAVWNYMMNPATRLLIIIGSVPCWHRAQQHGLGVLLTGQDGNATVSWTGGAVNLWPLLGTGNWPALAAGNSKCCPAPKWAKTFIICCAIRSCARWCSRDVISGSAGSSGAKNPGRHYSAINNDWARSLDLTQKMLADGHDPSFQG